MISAWHYNLSPWIQKKKSNLTHVEKVKKMTDQISHSINQQVIERFGREDAQISGRLKKMWSPLFVHVDRSTFHQWKRQWRVNERSNTKKIKTKKKPKSEKQFEMFLMCVTPQFWTVIGGNTRVCSCFQVAVIWAKPTPLICSVGLSKHIRSVLGELARRPRWVSK